MNKPYFSIITVTKNCQDTIKKTLESVKLQSFDDYEHIVVDGFSNDNTFQIINNYKSNKIIKKQINDSNCYEGLNNAIKFVRGRFIILLHSGDIFYSDQTLEMVKENINENVDLVICNCIFFDKFNKIRRIWKIKNQILNIFNCYKVPHTSTIMSNKLINTIGNYKLNYKIASDTEYLLRIFQNKNINYIILNNYLCFMKLGGLSTNLKFFLKKIREDLNIYLIFFGKRKFIYQYLKKIVFKINQNFFLKNTNYNEKILLKLLKR
tara:strand:- start:94 stop:888 length:795 start_codon:yes stop_codon:yes gene_type:complete